MQTVMSMTEALAASGGGASGTRILETTISIGQTLRRVLHSFQDASRELDRLNIMINTLQTILQNSLAVVKDVHMDKILSCEVERVLGSALKQFQEELCILEAHLPNWLTENSRIRCRTNLCWSFFT